MNIELITNTPNPEEILVDAFSKCYQKQANIGVVTKHLKHQSVLEHVSYTFDINCSRLTHLQIVRHRLASYTSQSHRYTEAKKEDLFDYIPSKVLAEFKAEEWINDMISQFEIYQKWINYGFKKEEARYHLPSATSINFRMTMNLRSIINFLQLRLDKHAQEEVRLIAIDMMEIVLKTLPNLSDAIKELVLNEE